MKGIVKLWSDIVFPPFRLDLSNERVWRENHRIHLRPKTFAVLRYLVEHAEQLVTKEELMRAVWPGTYISPVVPMVCVRELRKIFGDIPQAPRFIETVHRRGYRFIGSVQGLESGAQTHNVLLLSDPQPQTSNLVGRETELSRLRLSLEQALAGRRQVVFVSGETGIGKTTLIEAFLKEAAAKHPVWIARGQCLEQYSAGEAYLPVLDALDRLCCEPNGASVSEILGQNAPTWLVQLPWLIDTAHADNLQTKVLSVTTNRMLREFATVVERLTSQRSLVLWIEDLHWSDYSTLDLLAFLARRREPARLLVIGTYRPVEVLSRKHPLSTIQQELAIHKQCEELVLDCLTETATKAYVEARFAGSESVAELAPLIYQRTEGHPLFLVNMVDHLIAQGVIARVNGRWERQGDTTAEEIGIPDSLRQMIERQIDRLSEKEQRCLETASVAGIAFSAATVAAGLAAADVEERCETLTRRGQFLQSQGVEEWPDGTVAARYRFIHTLYQDVLYDRVTVGRRIRLHRKIGERMERGYGKRAKERAAELALHFEQGRDYQRAAQYLHYAAEREYLLKAIDLARQQQAKMLGLHTAVRLARLWRQQGTQH